MDGRPIGAALALALLIFVILIVRDRNRDHPVTPPAPVCVVSVEGDVAAEGIYLFGAGRVSAADAIEAAGGLFAPSGCPAPASELQPMFSGLRFPSSDLRLHSGESMRISVLPGGVHAEVARMDAAARLALGYKLDLNAASESDLLLIPQMKSETARAICDRRALLPWSSAGELREIRGIGPKTAAKWSEYLEAPQK
jgi:DNA uptake protein ComE-like DNA-binding protein